MKQGQLVTVVDARGNKLTRKVVSVSDRKIYVCKSEEFASAMQERREPNAIGLPVDDVELIKKSP
jgi:phosphoribosyl-dephospho-CoA transferase